MNKVMDYYSTFDEWGRLDREPLEFQINWHYIQKYLPENGSILDNGAGPGKYAMKLAEKGFQVTLTDLTPKLVKVAENKAKEFELFNQFNGFHIMDAKDLNLLEEKEFDASLMMGPMYHLQNEQDRDAAVKELYRVTKNEGVVFVSFMSRIRHTLSSLLHPEMWKPNNTMDNIEEFIATGEFNHQDEGRFTGAYYFDIQEINPFMESNGFETLSLVGSSSIGSLLSREQWDYWTNKGQAEVDRLIELLKKTATDPHTLGVSSHLLYIGRKKDI
ncbi:class I SAM-dependent methyltransferase [Priestia aryabhattai]|uniref:Class I SAM-dependent methyltransferase n=1 Tax=Priestia aryabhattai TaxID=412384 RepID=A0AAX6N4K4_PRIAR|nr:class I SAM-dependent methyltransferase [Priestia aryabhattai]MDU9690863.1 class I SAM-dependent methyltransferase [Priestia aryabhattai]